MSTIPTRRELLAWMLAVVLAITAVVVSRSDPVGAGAVGPTTEVVYIATGANFPDALAAAATAAVGLGPVLLVEQSSIPAATLTELNRLQPSRIVIVGGTAVISSGVQSQLQGLGFSPTVTRIAGANRFETAAMLSEVSFPTTGLHPRAAHAHSTAIETLTGAVQTLLSVDIEAPAPGILLVTAGADLSGGTALADCWIRVGEAGVVPGSRRHVFHGDNNQEEDCTTEVGVEVGVGAHTVDFRFSSVVPLVYQVLNRSLTVVWVPFDGNGAVPAP